MAWGVAIEPLKQGDEDALFIASISAPFILVVTLKMVFFHNFPGPY